MIRRLRLPLAVVAVVVVVIVIALASGSSSTTPRPAPPLPTQHLSGTPVTLAALHGQPAIVVFWASWCPPCHSEAPAIERYATTVPGHAPVVGVDFNDDAGSARSFIASYHWTFPVVRDGDGATKGPWGLLGMPTTVVLDARGRIAERLTGEQTIGSLTRAIDRVRA